MRRFVRLSVLSVVAAGTGTEICEPLTFLVPEAVSSDCQQAHDDPSQRPARKAGPMSVFNFEGKRRELLRQFFPVAACPAVPMNAGQMRHRSYASGALRDVSRGFRNTLGGVGAAAWAAMAHEQAEGGK
jgi:hypothetical protein